jgi:hypothetical protein
VAQQPACAHKSLSNVAFCFALWLIGNFSMPASGGEQQNVAAFMDSLHNQNDNAVGFGIQPGLFLALS